MSNNTTHAPVQAETALEGSTLPVEVKEALANAPVAATASNSMREYVFDTAASFEQAQRMAKALASTSLVPKEYQNNVPNCLIAIELSQRSGAPILSVMQNLNIINGRPGWSSQFIIAAINNSGRFKPLRFKIVRDKKKRRITYELTKYRYVNRERIADVTVHKATIQNVTVYAYTEDRDGNKLVGPEVSLEMAYKEGWVDKDGSKWRTMPDLMINYRAAAFFGRLYCPDILMGMHTTEEIMDVDDWQEPKGRKLKTINKKSSDLNAELEKEASDDAAGN